MAQALAKAATEWSFDTLVPISRDDLITLFKTLDAPTAQEMDGDFISTLPSYYADEWRASMARVGKDYWLGKSYSPQPLRGHTGHGLNRYRAASGEVSRQSRFVWDFGPSILDGRPSLIMRYAAFDNWGAQHDLTDEIRVVAPELYIGLAHTDKPVPGFTPRAGGDRSGVEFFFLAGPVAPFVGTDRD